MAPAGPPLTGHSGQLRASSGEGTAELTPPCGSQSFLLPSQVGVHFECCGKPRPHRPYEGEQSERKASGRGRRDLCPWSPWPCSLLPAASASDLILGGPAGFSPEHPVPDLGLPQRWAPPPQGWVQGSPNSRAPFLRDKISRPQPHVPTWPCSSESVAEPPHHCILHGHLSQGLPSGAPGLCHGLPRALHGGHRCDVPQG